jgi:hypothetical protein
MAGVVVVVVVDDDDDDGHRHFSKICLHDPSHQVRRVHPLIQHHQVSHDHQTRDTAVNFRHKFSAKNCNFWIVGSLPANNGCPIGKPRLVPAPPNGSGGDGMAVAGGSKMEQIEQMRKMDKKWWIWLVLVLSYFLILFFGRNWLIYFGHGFTSPTKKTGDWPRRNACFLKHADVGDSVRNRWK